MSRERFCKRCGSKIDSISNKCSSCGKQYFRPERFVIGLLSVLLVLGVGYSSFVSYVAVKLDDMYKSKSYDYERMHKQWEESQDAYYKLKTEYYESLNSRETSSENEWDKFVKEYNILHPKYDVMDYSFVADLNDLGGSFHKATCEQVQDIPLSRRIYFPTKYLAEVGGYKPCPDCNPE